MLLTRSIIQNVFCFSIIVREMQRLQMFKQRQQDFKSNIWQYLPCVWQLNRKYAPFVIHFPWASRNNSMDVCLQACVRKSGPVSPSHRWTLTPEAQRGEQMTLGCNTTLWVSTDRHLNLFALTAQRTHTHTRSETPVPSTQPCSARCPNTRTTDALKLATKKKKQSMKNTPIFTDKEGQQRCFSRSSLGLFHPWISSFFDLSETSLCKHRTKGKVCITHVLLSPVASQSFTEWKDNAVRLS